MMPTLSRRSKTKLVLVGAFFHLSARVMCIIHTLCLLWFIVNVLSVDTSSNLSRLNQDTLRMVYSFLSIHEKAYQFRRINTIFDRIFVEDMKTNEMHLMNTILQQIKHRWDFDSSIRDIRVLHRILCTSELYSIAGPRKLKQWMVEMGCSSQSHTDPVSDSSHLTSLRADITRRVKSAMQLTPIPIHTDNPEWKAFNALDLFTRTLIRNSRIIIQDAVIPSLAHNDADRKVVLLWWEHLWQHLSVEQGHRQTLPSLQRAFDFDDGPNSRYLLHLMMDCGLAMIHPIYFHKIWHRKEHWQTLWSAKCVFDRKARKCLVGTSNDFMYHQIYDLFTAKFLIMACFNSHRDRNFAQTLEETDALKDSVKYLHHHQHRDVLYQLLDGIHSKIPVVLSMVLQGTTKWPQLVHGQSGNVMDWEQGIDLLSVGCSVLMMTKSDPKWKSVNEHRARKVIESAVHWIMERQDNQSVPRSLQIIKDLVQSENMWNTSAWTFIPEIHKSFPWIIPRYDQNLEYKKYMEAVHDICTTALPSKQHQRQQTLRKRTGDDFALSILKGLSC